MTPKEQKDLLMGFAKWANINVGYTQELVDQYLATLTPTSERYKATMAFFDKLPDGLREMAKENYEEGYLAHKIPKNICDAVWYGFLWDSKQGYDFWKYVYRALWTKLPSITLNGTTYDLTKCYE